MAEHADRMRNFVGDPLTAWLRAIPQLEILDSVVEPIAIQMVDALRWQ